MKKFESPEVKVIKFVSNDVITTSGYIGDNSQSVWGSDEETVDESTIY